MVTLACKQTKNGFKFKLLNFGQDFIGKTFFGNSFYKKVVFPQIKNMLEVIFENSKEYLQFEKINSNTIGAFHRLAIDIMPDSQFKLYLLEINASPGMNAPEYHWKGLDNYLISLVDILHNKTNKKFILIK